MDGWVGGWIDEFIDGWMDRWTDELMHRWMDGCMDGFCEIFESTKLETKRFMQKFTTPFIQHKET